MQRVIKGHIKIALARKINNKEIKTTEHSGLCQYVTCLSYMATIVCAL